MAPVLKVLSTCVVLGTAVKLRNGQNPDQWKQDPCEIPALCEAPFRCDEGHYDTEKVLATADGHANYKTWCGTELPFRDERAAAACAAGNFTGYTKLMLHAKLTRGQGLGAWKSIFAHYCFSMGHCSDTKVTEKTTLAEAEAICDDRVGHEYWTSMTGKRVREVMQPFGMELYMQGGLHLSPEGENVFAATSCAQGVYHCDAHLCRQEFCPEGDWRAFAKPI